MATTQVTKLIKIRIAHSTANVASSLMVHVVRFWARVFIAVTVVPLAKIPDELVITEAVDENNPFIATNPTMPPLIATQTIEQVHGRQPPHRAWASFAWR